MHRLILFSLLIVLFAGNLHAQNATVGCGDPSVTQEVLETFGPLFTGDDSVSVRYRTENNLQRVSASETVVVTDATTCESLALRATALLQASAWDYWCNARWETYFLRAGPYYYVHVAEIPPAGVVGGGSYEFVLDATTLEEIPTPYSFQ